MTHSDSDLREEIVRLEAAIDELAGVIDRSRKIDIVAKAAIGAGAICLLGSVLGLIGLAPIALISALAAAIGGIVLFGSNASTLRQASSNIRDAEARRAELIGRIDLRPVHEVRDRSLGRRSPDPQ